jgi:hypothetical protein
MSFASSYRIDVRRRRAVQGGLALTSRRRGHARLLAALGIEAHTDASLRFRALSGWHRSAVAIFARSPLQQTQQPALHCRDGAITHSHPRDSRQPAKPTDEIVVYPERSAGEVR